MSYVLNSLIMTGRKTKHAVQNTLKLSTMRAGMLKILGGIRLPPGPGKPCVMRIQILKNATEKKWENSFHGRGVRLELDDS